MSRAVKADYDFDKELFADTLIKAIGARTQVKFSQDAGVSPAYLNRYLNKSVDKAPIPDTLRKIASASMGVLSYEELLIAAGYDPDKHKEQNIYNNSVRNNFMDGLVETIKKYGITLSNHENISNQFYSPAERFTVTGAPFEDLYLVLYPENNDGKPDRTIKDKMDYIYGVLATQDSTKSAKTTIITDSMKIFKQLTATNPYYLSMYVSILLIDPDECTPFIERYLPSALPENEDVLKCNIGVE